MKGEKKGNKPLSEGEREVEDPEKNLAHTHYTCMCNRHLQYNKHTQTTSTMKN